MAAASLKLGAASCGMAAASVKLGAASRGMAAASLKLGAASIPRLAYYNIKRVEVWGGGSRAKGGGSSALYGGCEAKRCVYMSACESDAWSAYIFNQSPHFCISNLRRAAATHSTNVEACMSCTFSSLAKFFVNQRPETD